MNITTRIDRLRHERNELLRDLYGMSRTTSSYEMRQAKVNALNKEIEGLYIERARISSHKAGYGVELMDGSQVSAQAL